MTETQKLLALLNESFPDIASMTPLEAREQVDARIRPAENLEDAEHEDHSIATDSGQLRIRIYTPQSPARSPRSLPVAVYAHGGGFLHGSIESHDGFCRRWAQRTGMTVISVDYRLAPEAGAPASSDDLLSAVKWASANGLGNDFVIAGDSSGANTAAVTALMMRETPGLQAVGLVLLYPFLDPTQSSPSYARLGDSNFVTAGTLATYWKHYLDAPGTQKAEPWQVNPALAPDLTGLPSTIVVTAGLDPLQDEGREFARALANAGAAVTHRLYPDQFHGFLTIMGFGPALAAQETLWSDLTKITQTSSTEPHKE